MSKLRREEGATLIEFAFIVPVILLLALGVVDMGRLLFTQITLNEAVQEGSLYVSRNPSDPFGARQRVVDSVDSPAIDINRVTIVCPSGSSGTIRVSVEHDMDLITGVFAGGSVTLDAVVDGDRFSSDPCISSP